jgi:hypothetical protein
MTDVSTDYKSTVFLPRTEFPMRGDLPVRGAGPAELHPA